MHCVFIMGVFLQANYVASRIVVVAAGNVEHEEFANQVAKAFAAIPEKPSGPAVISQQAPAYFTGSDIRVRDDEVLLHTACLLILHLDTAQQKTYRCRPQA